MKIIITNIKIRTMKKIYKVLAIVIAVAFLAIPAEAKVFRFGVKAGLNLTDFNMNSMTESLISPDNNCGWNAGVIAEVQLPVVGICADVSVMYSRLNQKFQDKVAAGFEEEDNTLPNNFGNNFLEIPLHVKYKFNLPLVSNVFSPYLLTGPAFAFNLNKKTFDDVRNRKCQTSWDFGVGFELFSHLQIQGAYCLGMNNLAKYWGDIDVQDNIKVKNNYWNISAAWLF